MTVEESKKELFELVKLMMQKRYSEDIVLTAIDLLTVIPMPEKMLATTKFLEAAQADLTQDEFILRIGYIFDVVTGRREGELD